MIQIIYFNFNLDKIIKLLIIYMIKFNRKLRLNKKNIILIEEEDDNFHKLINKFLKYSVFYSFSKSYQSY